MSRLLAIIGAVVIALSVDPAQAQVCPDSEYGNLDKAKVSIGKIGLQLKEIVGRIEGVSPSDAAYIESEKKAALEQRNRARFDLVTSHAFYYAHQVSAEMSEISSALDEVNSAVSVKHAAKKLALVQYKLVDLFDVIEEYAQADVKKPTPILGANGRRELSFDLTLVRPRLLRAIDCTIDLLRER